MIHILNEIHQKRCYVQHAADVRILLHQRVGIVVPLAALVDVLRQRHEQSGGISLLYQIPQVHQPRHSAVAIKVGVQIGNIEVDQGGFQQVVAVGILMDEAHQFAHALRQLLPRQSGMLYLGADHIHAVVPIEAGGTQTVLLRQIGADGGLIQLVDGCFGDPVGGVADEFQPLLHAIDAVLAFVRWSKAGQDLADTVTGEIHLLNGEGGDDLLLHGICTVKLCAALRRQQDPGGREMHLRDTIQIDKLLPGKVLQWQRMVEAAFQQRNKLPHIRLRIFVAQLLQVQQTFIRQHFGKQCSVHITPLDDNR